MQILEKATTDFVNDFMQRTIPTGTRYKNFIPADEETVRIAKVRGMWSRIKGTAHEQTCKDVYQECVDNYIRLKIWEKAIWMTGVSLASEKYTKIEWFKALKKAGMIHTQSHFNTAITNAIHDIFTFKFSNSAIFFIIKSLGCSYETFWREHEKNMAIYSEIIWGIINNTISYDNEGQAKEAEYALKTLYAQCKKSIWPGAINFAFKISKADAIKRSRVYKPKTEKQTEMERRYYEKIEKLKNSGILQAKKYTY